MNNHDRLTADRLNERGCIAMLCAMLRYMSKEFRAVYAYYLSHPFDARAYARYNLVRDDFLADRFNDLTRLDGRKVVDRLEQIVSSRFYAKMASALCDCTR